MPKVIPSGQQSGGGKSLPGAILGAAQTGLGIATGNPMMALSGASQFLGGGRSSRSTGTMDADTDQKRGGLYEYPQEDLPGIVEEDKSLEGVLSRMYDTIAMGDLFDVGSHNIMDYWGAQLPYQPQQQPWFNPFYWGR